MNEIVKIRHLELGTGMPKICIPLMGGTLDILKQEGEEALREQADFVEWRGDCFQGIADRKALLSAAQLLRRTLGEMPILFTCRTEDGRFSIGPGEYLELNKHVIENTDVDLVDIELFMGQEICTSLTTAAHSNGKAVVLSNHDFLGTPTVDCMEKRLEEMRSLGGDLPKLAVMPHNASDVLKLLQVTEEYSRRHEGSPLITMSMGMLGSISRISGQFFGSCATFAAAGQASAPGQLPVQKVRQILRIFHEES